jgi:hypothetical protein
MNSKERLLKYLKDKEILDKECKVCEPHGVTCLQVGCFSFSPASPGESIIIIDGKLVMKDKDNIQICPVVAGINTSEEVVAKLRREAEKYK